MMPAEVRAYLREMGVPLYVWAIEPVSSTVEAKWGAIRPIADWRQLHAAAERLRNDLDAQRIVWVSTGVLQTGDLQVDSRCRMALLSGRP